MTYFMVAPECIGMLWNKLGVGMSVYYPIAVVTGVVFAGLCLWLFIRKTDR